MRGRLSRLQSSRHRESPSRLHTAFREGIFLVAHEQGQLEQRYLYTSSISSTTNTQRAPSGSPSCSKRPSTSTSLPTQFSPETANGMLRLIISPSESNSEGASGSASTTVTSSRRKPRVSSSPPASSPSTNLPLKAAATENTSFVADTTPVSKHLLTRRTARAQPIRGGFPRTLRLGFLVNKRCYCLVLCSLSTAHYAQYYTGQS